MVFLVKSGYYIECRPDRGLPMKWGLSRLNKAAKLNHKLAYDRDFEYRICHPKYPAIELHYLG